MSLVQILASVYVSVLLVFTLGFLINWYRNRATMSSYKRLGLWAGLIFLGFELLTLILSVNAIFLASFNMCLLLAALGWGVLRIWGFVNNGIFFSNQLNIRSFPLFAPRLGLPPAPAPVAIPTVESITIRPGEETTPGTDTPIGSDVVPPEPIEPVAAPEPVILAEPPPNNWPRYWLSILGVSVGAVAYSAVLFLITQPRPGPISQDLMVSGEPIMTPLTLVILLEFAFAEELIFRLGIQNYLGAKLINKRYGYAMAIVLTAGLWSIAHVGSLTPDWVKLAQVFPLGLALGWLYRQQGTESAIMTHALFNFIGALVLSPLYLR